MMRGRRCRRAKREWLRVFAVAFGAGVLVAMLCSVRMALLAAALILIYVGITIRTY